MTNTKENRFKRDAFSLNLMGILYDATGDYNNAFIAYRNAVEAYQEDYASFFGLGPPKQLQKDLIRAAYRTGFYEEGESYEKEFGIKNEVGSAEGGELVFFWQNGLGPVKAEWSINFGIIPGEGGLVTFVNDEHGFSFPFFLSGDNTDEDQSKLSSLKVIRVAFPKYVKRAPFYSSALIKANGKDHELELAQPINNIAFKTLEDRMLRELGNTLLRLALKQATEYAARSENEGFGALVGVFNTLTEKADTRNWQTLPYSISYTRIQLPAGENDIELKALSTSGGVEKSHKIHVKIIKGKTNFHTFHNLESMAGVY